MTSKRKAELQRKLSMISVPEPPDGLAERIKGEIPAHIKGQRAPSSSRHQLLKIAAMLVVVIGALFATRQLFVPLEEPRFPVAVEKPRGEDLLVPATTAVERIAKPPIPAAGDETEHLTPEELATLSRIGAEPPARTIATEAAPPPAAAPVADAMREQAPLVAQPAARTEESRVAGSTPEFAGPSGAATGAVNETRQMADAAGPAPQSAPAARIRTAPAPPAAPRATDATEMQLTVTAEARAAKSAAAGSPTFFGVSIDPDAYPALRRSLDAGRPSRVNLDAIVNHFAGPAGSTGAGHLEAEGSTSPAGSGGAILRLTASVGRNTLDASTTARLEIDVDRSVVKSFRTLAGADSTQTTTFQQAPPPDDSVTRLFVVNLQPGVESSARAVTIRLYLDSKSGGSVNVERTILAGEFASPWSLASPLHRRTTLAGVWAAGLAAGTVDPRTKNLAATLRASQPDDRLSLELEKSIELSLRRNAN